MDFTNCGAKINVDFVARQINNEVPKGAAAPAGRLNELDRVAVAVGFKLVYAIVPLENKSLVEIAEWRKWKMAVEAGSGE